MLKNNEGRIKSDQLGEFHFYTSSIVFSDRDYIRERDTVSFWCALLHPLSPPLPFPSPLLPSSLIPSFSFPRFFFAYFYYYIVSLEQ